MSHEDILKKICTIAAIIWNVPSEKVYDKSHKPEIIDVRASIYYALMGLNMNFTFAEISTFVVRDRRTVWTSVHKIEAIERMKPNLRTMREERLLHNAKKLLKQVKIIVG